MNDDDVATSITSILDGNKYISELTLVGEWDIRDEVLIELANALANNNTLTDLDIGYINRVFERRIIEDKSAGIKALSRILCDRSSIDATFRSNHTLTRVYLRVRSEILLEDFDGLPTLWRPTTIQDHYPSHLTNMLQLNRNDNKFEVSRQKILRCHFDDYDTQQFLDMDLDLEVLPHALAWCGGDYRGPSLLYGLIKSQPSLFDSTCRMSKAGAPTKRKRNE